jgi:hypothetical protein
MKETKFSTPYTIFHFWKINILVGLSIAGLYWLMFELTGMRSFLMNVGGLFPYTLHMYLKKSL